MTVCTITYDASTGSNAASGSNAPTTPHTQAAFAVISGTGAGTTFTFDSGTHDLSGVLDDDTDVLRVVGNAGERHLFRITAFTGGVSTCTGFTVTPAIDATTITASDWSIGGIRLNMWQDGTRTDWADILAGWDHRLQDTADFVVPTIVTPIALPQVGDLTDGSARISAVFGHNPRFTWAESGTRLFSVSGDSQYQFRGVNAFNGTVGGSNESYMFASGTNNRLWFIDCDVDAGGGFLFTNEGYFFLQNCNIAARYLTTTVAIRFSGGRPQGAIISCQIHDSGVGIEFASNTAFHGFQVIGNNIWDCDNEAILFRGATSDAGLLIKNNVLHGNGGSAILITGTISITVGNIIILNNILTDNLYGIEVVSPNDAVGSMLVYENQNAFRGNASGEVTGIEQGANDVTLTADPYTDEATDDFTLNDAAGGGALCKNVGVGYRG